jgi:hypothetical protein
MKYAYILKEKIPTDTGDFSSSLLSLQKDKHKEYRM